MGKESFPLVLASRSPRRRELLALTGWTFTAVESPFTEETAGQEPPESLARQLATGKAQAVHPIAYGRTVLAADTLVVDEGEVLGKPRDPEDARRMLLALRGKEHQVITAITLIEGSSGRILQDLCRTEVPMREYTMDEIQTYLASGSPSDKAGAYGIQDQHFDPVDRDSFGGCFANVMGLPLCHLVRTARKLGIEPEQDVPTACRDHTGYPCKIFPDILRGER